MVALTFSTGMVDAATYLSLDRVFAANMTGNVVYVGLGILSAGHVPVMRPALALGGFGLGAALAGVSGRRWLASRRSRERAACLLWAVAGSLLLLSLALGASARAPIPINGLTTVIGATMGIQAAAARMLAVTDLPTVVVTSTLTALASEPWFGHGGAERSARRALAIGAIAGGALLGAGLVQIHAWMPILVAAAICSWVARRVTHLSRTARMDGG